LGFQELREACRSLEIHGPCFSSRSTTTVSIERDSQKENSTNVIYIEISENAVILESQAIAARATGRHLIEPTDFHYS
jgi:hypothetical protein